MVQPGYFTDALCQLNQWEGVDAHKSVARRVVDAHHRASRVRRHLYDRPLTHKGVMGLLILSLVWCGIASTITRLSSFSEQMFHRCVRLSHAPCSLAVTRALVHSLTHARTHARSHSLAHSLARSPLAPTLYPRAGSRRGSQYLM